LLNELEQVDDPLLIGDDRIHQRPQDLVKLVSEEQRQSDTNAVLGDERRKGTDHALAEIYRLFLHNQCRGNLHATLEVVDLPLKSQSRAIYAGGWQFYVSGRLFTCRGRQARCGDAKVLAAGGIYWETQSVFLDGLRYSFFTLASCFLQFVQPFLVFFEKPKAQFNLFFQ
jgi:hypothetical protein